MNKPAITTAIPLRRYSFGEFTLTVLGEIDSPDDRRYRYIMAVVQGTDPEPGLYLTAEEQTGGEVAMRIMMADGEEVIGRSPDWRDVAAFTEEAIAIVSRVLSLSDETPYQLM